MIEAQPEKLEELSAADKALGVVEETFRKGDGPSRFGRINAKVRDHKTSDPDAPFEIIAEGDDLSANLARMQLFAHGVNRAGFAYRGDHQNSNSFAGAALQAGELPPATGVAHDPAGPPGELLEFFAPGLNEPLRSPIGLDEAVVPPGRFGDTSSPVLRALQKDRRSAAPDGTAWTSAPVTPTFQQEGPYSRTGDFYGNFPRASVIAAAPSPAASNASGPGPGSQIADALNAAGNAAVPALTRAGKFIGDSLITPAEAASPPALPLQNSTAPNLPGDDTRGIDSIKPERRLSRRIVNPSAGASGDRPSSPASRPQEFQGPLSLNDAYLLYLARRNANKPQASMSDPAASAAPFDASNRNPPRLGAADWIAFLAGVDPQNPSSDSTDHSNYSGGLLGRYLALAGLDPDNPNPPAPPLADEQEQANLQELDERLSSTGNIRDAWALYKAGIASRTRGICDQA